METSYVFDYKIKCSISNTYKREVNKQVVKEDGETHILLFRFFNVYEILVKDLYVRGTHIIL